jgi:glycerophosphoryl diester phosphodiesterase
MRALSELREAAPWLPRSYTYPERPASALLRPLLPLRLPPWLEQLGAAATTLKGSVITRRVVEACRRRGVAVHAWTINDPRTARALVETGVDAIITDDPRSVPGGITDT